MSDERVAAEHGDGRPDGERELAVDVRRGHPTAEELAALLAVVTEAYARESADAVVADAPVRSAWQFSARSLRRDLDRGLGWR